MKACPSFETALAQLSKDGNEPKLKVDFAESTSVTHPGIKLSSAATKAAPTLAIASSLVKSQPDDRFIAVCLDLDAPFPSWSVLGPAAHWIEIDLVATRFTPDGWSPLESKTKSPMFYAGPGPPPPSAPHRYVFVIWEQPEGTNLETMRKSLRLSESPGISARMRWDQPAFERKLGLGEPLAVNYFVASSD